MHEGSGLLVTPEAIRYDGLLMPTNNTAELQAIEMCLQWCLDNPNHVHSNRRIVVCSSGKVKVHAPYVQHLRELLKCVRNTYPTVTGLFHKVEGHSVRDDREARGNNRVDSLAKYGAGSYVSIPLPHPRLPPSVASRSVRPPPSAPGRDRRRPATDTPSASQAPLTWTEPRPPCFLLAPCGAICLVE